MASVKNRTKKSAGKMPSKTAKSSATVAFQGEHGAFSDIACRTVFPNAKTLPCTTFDDAFAAVTKGRADMAMIPIENAIAGRVADVHHLMPGSDLHIVGEHFQPVNLCLLGVKGSKISSLTHVHSHVMALPQCRPVIRALNLEEVVHEDTAGAAAEVARNGDKTQAAIASEFAGQMYGLDVLKKNIQSRSDNVTRFLILSPTAKKADAGQDCITTFVFKGQNIPAFLYKALGAFATNEINVTKIESYLGEGFRAAEFYCDVQGHPDDVRMKHAFDEINFYTKGNYRILGTYPAHPFRKAPAAKPKR